MSNTTAENDLAKSEQVWIGRAGSWQQATLQDAVTRRRDRDAPPVWVRLTDPAHLHLVAERLGVPSDALPHAVHAGRGKHPGHPPFERLPGGGLSLSSPTLRYLEPTQDVDTGTLTIVLADNVILTAEQGDAGTQDAAAERLRSPDVAMEEGARQVLAVLLLTLAAAAAHVEIALGEAVADTEQDVFSSGGADPVQRIYGLKREIAEARRALVPFSAELPDLMANDEEARRGGEAQPWLRHLERSVDRLDRRLDGHDRLLGDMLAATLSRVTVRQNEDMRKISAWAAIAAVPTLVASVYGMNFQHMPELSATFGYPVALAAMVSVCVVLHHVFKRSGWL